MKIVRRLLIVLAVVAAVFALVAITAFLPAVQRWAVLRAIGSRPGMKLGIERLAVRPGSVALHNVDLTWPQGHLTLADGSADLSLWELAVHRRLIMDHASVTGLRVDLSDATASAAGGVVAAASSVPAAPAGHAVPPSPTTAVSRPAPVFPAFDGIFGHLQLPIGIVLNRCNVEAELIYPQASGRPPGRMQLTLTGGHFAPGQEAKFDFDAAIRNPDPSAPVATVETRGTVTAALDARGAFVRLNTHVEAEARGPKLATPARLQAYVALARTAAGESYAVLLNSVDAGAASHLLSLNIDYVAGSSQLTGTWQVAAGDRQLAPFALGLGLPEFSAVGEGRFEFNPVTLAARLAGRLSGEFSRLEVVDARLRDFDGLSANTSFDVDYDGTGVRVTELLVKISGRKPLLNLQSIQPFSLDSPPTGCWRRTRRRNCCG